MIINGQELDYEEEAAFKDFWWDFVDFCGSFENAIRDLTITIIPDSDQDHSTSR